MDYIGKAEVNIGKVEYEGTLNDLYENDLEKLLTSSHNFDILFKCDNGNHPKLIKAYLGKKITLETLVILEKVLKTRKEDAS